MAGRERVYGGGHGLGAAERYTGMNRRGCELLAATGATGLGGWSGGRRRRGGCRAERERHRAFDDDLAVDGGDALEHAHAAAQALHLGFDHHLIAGMDRAAGSAPARCP